jgi:hypothetical protein
MTNTKPKFDYDKWWDKVKDMPGDFGLTKEEIRCIIDYGHKRLLTPFDNFTWNRWIRMKSSSDNRGI